VRFFGERLSRPILHMQIGAPTPATDDHLFASTMRLRTRRRSGLVLFLFSLLLASTAACAAKHTAPSVPGERAETVAESKPCDRSDQDSSGYTHLPLYRACAVDVKARPRGTGARPDFTPPRTVGGCYFVAIEVVVDTSGTPEPGTARVLRTNDSMFANAVMSTIPTFGFTPARIGGTPVRQIFELSTAMTTQLSKSATDRTGPTGPTAGRRPPCASRR
jgi:hypothetical protein